MKTERRQRRRPVSAAYMQVMRGHWFAAFLAGESIEQIARWANTITPEVEAAIRRGVKRLVRK